MVVGGRFENAQRGEERKKRGRTLKNNDQNDARGIRDGLIKRFIPNSKPPNSFIKVSF